MVFSVRYQYSIYLWMHTKVLAFKVSILFPGFFQEKYLSMVKSKLAPPPAAKPQGGEERRML